MFVSQRREQAPLLYSCLIDSLDQQLPTVLIRIVLSFSDVLPLLITDSDLPTFGINVETDFLLVLSGRYAALPPTHYANQNFMRELCVGMHLDFMDDTNKWNTGFIADIADRHEDHIDSDDEYEDESECECEDACDCERDKHQDCQSQCPDGCKEAGECKQSESDSQCVLIKRYESDNPTWISTDTRCLVCQTTLPFRLRPFLSVWNDRTAHRQIRHDAYLCPGIAYSRPYLEEYSAQIGLAYDSILKEDYDCLYICDTASRSNLRRYKLFSSTQPLGSCDTCDYHSTTIAAMTCDDNGRIYALTRPCRRLVVVTLKSTQEQHDLLDYSLSDIVTCESAKASNSSEFILSIHDASMVLYIQEVEYTAAGGPKPVRTYAVALPLLQAIPPTFA